MAGIGEPRLLKRKVLSELESKVRRAAEIAVENSGERVLVFTESIKGAELVAKRARDLGADAQTFHSLRRAMGILRSWGMGLDVLCAVRALDEGVDAPEWEVGIIVSSSKSMRQLIQRTGRLLRPVEGKVARLYVLCAVIAPKR